MNDRLQSPLQRTRSGPLRRKRSLHATRSLMPFRASHRGRTRTSSPSDRTGRFVRTVASGERAATTALGRAGFVQVRTLASPTTKKSGSGSALNAVLHSADHKPTGRREGGGRGGGGGEVKTLTVVAALTIGATGHASAIDIAIYSCPYGYTLHHHGKVCLSPDKRRAECLYPRHGGEAARKSGPPRLVSARTCPDYPHDWKRQNSN
jgi:hypothetical protein